MRSFDPPLDLQRGGYNRGGPATRRDMSSMPRYFRSNPTTSSVPPNM